MAFGHFLAKLPRNLLSIVSIAVPTALVVFFLFVTLRLQGILYMSWLGQYIALQVGETHVIAMGLAVLIAVLTTEEVISRNVFERKPEIALLTAVGWRKRSIRLLVLYEGFFIGLAAAVLGIGLGMGALLYLYRGISEWPLLFLLRIAALPLSIGLLGALVPSILLIKDKPAQGVKGAYATHSYVDKLFKAALA